MINAGQTWNEKARMKLNSNKSKIVCFHEQCKPGMCENDHSKLMATLYGQRHSISYPCTQTTPAPSKCLTVTRYHPHSWGKATWLCGMKAAVASILEKANKAHSLALAVSYSLCYDKHHYYPTICSSPLKMLNLWKILCLPTLPLLPPLHLRWGTNQDATR